MFEPFNLVYKCSFEAICTKYIYKHSAVHSEVREDKDRVEIYTMCLTEGFYLYSLVEQKQRYLVPGPVSWGEEVEEALAYYHPLIKIEFSRRHSRHKCDKPGCRSVLVFDGGMKGEYTGRGYTGRGYTGRGYTDVYSSAH